MNKERIKEVGGQYASEVSRGRFGGRVVPHRLGKGVGVQTFIPSLKTQGKQTFPLGGPVLHDAARLSQRYPPIASYWAGVLCLNMSNWVRYPLPPVFWAFPPWRACEVEVRCPPPPTKGVSQRHLRDTTWKQGKMAAIPPLRYYLKRVLRDMGGTSRWAAKLKRGQTCTFQTCTLFSARFWP